MAFVKKFLAALTILYAIAVLALLSVFSAYEYEFMIGEIDDGKPITICNLPPGSDDSRMLYAVLTFLLLALLLGSGVVRATRRRRLNLQLVLGIVTLAVWSYQFFGRKLAC